VPADINALQVQHYLAHLPHVIDVHDLHIWAISTTEAAMTAHLVLNDISEQDALVASICTNLHDSYGIEHATIQVETNSTIRHCCLACDTHLSASHS